MTAEKVKEEVIVRHPKSDERLYKEELLIPSRFEGSRCAVFQGIRKDVFEVGFKERPFTHELLSRLAGRTDPNHDLTIRRLLLDQHSFSQADDADHPRDAGVLLADELGRFEEPGEFVRGETET